MKGCLSVNGIVRYSDGVGVVIGVIVAVIKLKCGAMGRSRDELE